MQKPWLESLEERCLLSHQITDLGAFPALRPSQANAINNEGQAAGYAFSGGSNRRAVLWQDGGITGLGTLGGSESNAFGINDQGQVVGYSFLPDDTTNHAFLWQGGAMTDLGTLGGDFSLARGINAQGQVVGYSFIPGTSTNHAFLWQDGAMTDLGTLPGFDSS
jgi:probable HAF family extracellular repeat protein